MSKLTLWITKKISLILFVTILSVGTTGWIVSSYMQHTLKELNINAPTTLDIIQKSIFPFYEPKLSAKPAFAQETSSLWTTLNQKEEKAPPLLDTGNKKEEESPKKLWREGEVIVAQKESTETLMTKEAIEQHKQMISAKDRMDIFSILLSNVPEEEMEFMFDLLSDGLTGEEAIQIDAKLKTYLGEEEYKFISDIIKKYENLAGRSN
jgi:hypothetical protein